ncbi:helicase [Pleurocapsa sp. CCALA 161]|uniref:helicase-related protein n=1 Tax=Pleurocapsa sp. CCALA 161 TaxID=2107688 RepID=UPI000D06E29E|nr:helicase-related protein [Pleurocapsa sp. CCALA 161]PSB09808.1 helicase [Pleurocapsa sp. CCALA 161]
MHLQDHSWRISYSSNENNPIIDFYIPALECAVQYDRKSGFFGSAILSKVARGLGAMLHNHGKIRLIMGCQFSPQDIAAIEKGYELREALAFRLEADLQAPANFVQLKHFEILSWLIANEYLDIKIAVPTKDKGIPLESDRLLDPNHIFHEKVGIFTDSKGDRLAFSGSNNESISGWSHNVESFHVYCGWEGDRDLERVNEEAYRFEQLWNDLSPNVKIFEIPEAVKQKLLTYTPDSKPSWKKEEEIENSKFTKGLPACIQNSKLDNIQPSPDAETKNTDIQDIEASKMFALLANLHQHPGCLDFCLKSIPIQPWAHQLKILRRVAANFPCSFLIADEVGLGKTIETGLILRYLILSKKVKRVLILAPASVQPQWQEELREKFNLHFGSYSQGKFKDCYGGITSPTSNPWNTQDLVLASSHLVRRTERMEELLAAEPWDLVILDEAHHARRKSPQQRKDTPNRLLQLMQQLKNRTKSLILLSATPMQIDPIEVFDLLNLVGLAGHWSYGDNFCNYFSSLSDEPDSHTLDFWQTMSTDYFRRGGEECPKGLASRRDRLEEHLVNGDRLMAYKLRDTWKQGKSIVNPKQLAQDTPFINASRQYLTVNTPLKDLMFRHTRDTLRQYYKLGILDRDIPRRIVSDNAIALEPNREVPLYQAVSDYVRHFYRLAQKENRKALGFLMTLYRKRLTSSFYAIRESLQRRLEGINNITQDDLSDLDDADDAVITGLETYLAEPVDPKEIEYLENLLRQFENTGEDSKLSHFLTILRRELSQRESAIVFTQYTDTMDYLRDNLRQLFGSQVACYSGRGGELYLDGEWQGLPKEEIKKQFKAGIIKILLCTESASEGLNLQTCGVLINYDLPWNPMRVEQRIGRIDRIGQAYSTVNIHNFYYDGTVEAKVYRKLRDRIDAFQSVVGNLQPILAQVPTFIEQAVMSADPEEEGVLLAEFEQVLDTPPLHPGLEEMVSQRVAEVPSVIATGEPVRVAMDVKADLKEIRKPLVPSPITSEQIEALFTNSQILLAQARLAHGEETSPSFLAQNIFFESKGDRIWELTDKDKTYAVTFYPEVFDQKPSLRLINPGEPLFQKLLEIVDQQNKLSFT